MFQGTFSLIIEALHTDSNDDLSTGKTNWNPSRELTASPLRAPEDSLQLFYKQKAQSVLSVAWPPRDI